MGLVNWLILRAQLRTIRKTHPEMAADLKRYMAAGHPPHEAIKLATEDQARRLRSQERQD